MRVRFFVLVLCASRAVQLSRQYDDPHLHINSLWLAAATIELKPRRLGAVSVKPRHPVLISDLVISDLVSLDTASMWS